MSVVTRFTLEQYELMAEAGVFDGKHRRRVELVTDCVEVFRDPGPSGYQSRQTRRGDEEIRSLAFDDLVITPSMLFRP